MSRLSTPSRRKGTLPRVAAAGTLGLSVVLVCLFQVVTAHASQAVPAVPADVGVTDPSGLAVVVVGAGLIGVLLFGVRLLTSRRARRQ